jgi:alanyl-tRNA synthetase
MFVILSESGISSGVRRIEAATGWNALDLLFARRGEMERIAERLKSRPGELAAKVEELRAECRKLRKELESGRTAAGGDIMSGLVSVGGIPLLAARVDDTPAKALREMMDAVRSRLPSGVACLAGVERGKVSLILYVSKDLHTKFTAPDLIRRIGHAVGAGGGGGRPDLAQTGGADPSGVAGAFDALRGLLAAAGG